MEVVEPIRDRDRIKAMKGALRGAGRLRDWCLLTLGINSGLRISDLLALTIGDVSGGRVRIRERKTGKAKDFPLGEVCTSAIDEYLATRAGANPTDPLFPSRKGAAAIQRNQAYKIINEAARAVGIKDRIGTHTLRKTFGYHAYQGGADIALVQKLLNHSSPGETLRYIGITRDDLDTIYVGLDL